MEDTGLVIVGIVILIGLLGVVIPVIPGLLLSWAAVLVWALEEQTTLAWAVLIGSTVVVLVSQVVKYAVPGRRMRNAGVPTRSMALGAVLAVIGFFVIPVVGLFFGFVLGVYVAERLRLGAHQAAWTSTVHALKAAGLSILIELAAGMVVAASWLGAVILG